MTDNDLTQKHQAAHLMEWTRHPSYAIFVEIVTRMKDDYLLMSAHSEYGAVMAANKAQALNDLTNELNAVMQSTSELDTGASVTSKTPTEKPTARSRAVPQPA